MRRVIPTFLAMWLVAMLVVGCGKSDPAPQVAVPEAAPPEPQLPPEEGQPASLVIDNGRMDTVSVTIDGEVVATVEPLHLVRVPLVSGERTVGCSVAGEALEDFTASVYPGKTYMYTPTASQAYSVLANGSHEGQAVRNLSWHTEQYTHYPDQAMGANLNAPSFRLIKRTMPDDIDLTFATLALDPDVHPMYDFVWMDGIMMEDHMEPLIPRVPREVLVAALAKPLNLDELMIRVRLRRGLTKAEAVQIKSYYDALVKEPVNEGVVLAMNEGFHLAFLVEFASFYYEPEEVARMILAAPPAVAPDFVSSLIWLPEETRWHVLPLIAKSKMIQAHGGTLLANVPPLPIEQVSMIWREVEGASIDDRQRRDWADFLPPVVPAKAPADQANPILLWCMEHGVAGAGRAAVALAARGEHQLVHDRLAGMTEEQLSLFMRTLGEEPTALGAAGVDYLMYGLVSQHREARLDAFRALAANPDVYKPQDDPKHRETLRARLKDESNQQLRAALNTQYGTSLR